MVMTRLAWLPVVAWFACGVVKAMAPPPVVKVDGGAVGGTFEKGLKTFRAIPFAAPPEGKLRWEPPQPVKPWSRVRPGQKFGNRCMQLPLFSDMVFRSPVVSEDCLYLNVWTTRTGSDAKRPVLVYFHGGGLAAGDGSEPRYDGGAMARRDIVVVTANYRLGVFGFLAHPELSAASPSKASGNYGLMDQVAALRWVRNNIARFGGDPAQVTIAGESAGSFSVSALMAMPSARGLFARAIGESGSVLGRPVPTLQEAEQQGTAFARAAGHESLAALRAAPAEQLLRAGAMPGMPWFGIVADGAALTQQPLDTYRRGEQAPVPLLAGWNSQEQDARAILDEQAPTRENFDAALQKLYGERAPDAAKAYAYDVEAAARDLASDRWIVHGTWKWIDLQAKVAPTYRYYFTRPRPASTDGKPAGTGATHSAEIEYALGNLAGNKVYLWQNGDRQASEAMQAYFANFIRTGNPNGKALPDWPLVTRPGANVMRLDVEPAPFDPQDGARFEFHERQAARP